MPKKSSAAARSRAAQKGWETRRARAREQAVQAAARSRAAQKGWETRRARAHDVAQSAPPRALSPTAQRAARSRAAQKGWETRRARAQAAASPPPPDPKHRLRLTAAVQATLRARGWRKTEQNLRMLRRDGRDAKHPAMARHRPYALDLLDRMHDPAFGGEYADFEALAAEYDEDVREIYTVFFS